MRDRKPTDAPNLAQLSDAALTLRINELFARELRLHQRWIRATQNSPAAPRIWNVIKLVRAELQRCRWEQGRRVTPEQLRDAQQMLAAE